MTANTENALTGPQALLERLRSGGLLVSDGATGTFLQQHGLEPGGCPEEFNASHPEVVREMARRYYEAGSDMALTNSFRGTVFMQKKYGYGERVAEFNRLAAEHARSQAPEGRFVVGSVGPTGEFLEPLGPVSESEMYDAFSVQVKALEAGGADAVVVETMTAAEEAALAVRAARENTGLVVMATMVFRQGAARLLHHDGHHAGGRSSRHGGRRGARRRLQLRQRHRQHAGHRPPNARGNRRVSAHPLKRRNPGHAGRANRLSRIAGILAERFRELADLGVNIIGGCVAPGRNTSAPWPRRSAARGRNGHNYRKAAASGSHRALRAVPRAGAAGPAFPRHQRGAVRQGRRLHHLDVQPARRRGGAHPRDTRPDDRARRHGAGGGFAQPGAIPVRPPAPAHAAFRDVAGGGQGPDYAPPQGELSIQDSKSALTIRATLADGEREGRSVYDVSLDGEARNAAMRLRMVLAGFTRYGEMEQVGESGVAFACGMPHDALMRVLLPYSRNISSVETMMAAEALRAR